MIKKKIIPLLLLVAIAFCFSVSAQAKNKGMLSGVVNINTATVEELVLLPGIGNSKAESIVSFRSNGKFASTDDLVKVKGIGNKLLSKIQAYITVDGPTTAKLVSDPSIGIGEPTAGEEG